jgi:hypothetical protein
LAVGAARAKQKPARGPKIGSSRQTKKRLQHPSREPCIIITQPCTSTGHAAGDKPEVHAARKLEEERSIVQAFKMTIGRWCSSPRPNPEDLFPTLWEPVVTKKKTFDDCGSTTDFRANVSPQPGLGVQGTARRHARWDPNISEWRSFEHGSDVFKSAPFSM